MGQHFKFHILQRRKLRFRNIGNLLKVAQWGSHRLQDWNSGLLKLKICALSSMLHRPPFMTLNALQWWLKTYLRTVARCEHVYVCVCVCVCVQVHVHMCACVFVCAWVRACVCWQPLVNCNKAEWYKNHFSWDILEILSHSAGIQKACWNWETQRRFTDDLILPSLVSTRKLTPRVHWARKQEIQISDWLLLTWVQECHLTSLGPSVN